MFQIAHQLYLVKIFFLKLILDLGRMFCMLCNFIADNSANNICRCQCHYLIFKFKNTQVINQPICKESMELHLCKTVHKSTVEKIVYFFTFGDNSFSKLFLNY